MSDLQTDLGGYVLLTEAPNLMRAHLIAGALEDAGIPFHVGEDNLADEWAMSLKLRGGLGVPVLVPSERIDEARTVFLAMSQPIPEVEEDEELRAHGSARARRQRLFILGLLALSGALTLFFVVLRWLGHGG